MRALGYLILVVLLTGCHITGERRQSAGYVDLEEMALVDGRREVSISLGSLPIRLASFFVEDELGDLLSDLDAVRIHIYKVSGNASRGDLNLASDKLRIQGWEPLVAIRGRDADATEVLVRLGRRHSVAGLVVMTQDEEELVVINLIGDLRPERFRDYLDGLDVDGPEIEIDAG